MLLSETQNIAQRLDVEKVLKVLDEEGPLSCTLKGFESRQQQKLMMQNILDAYNNDEIALIEAGTGTGKSLAYLIPAILWAAQTKERTLVSTNTITLQEQLLHKDIPIIAKALNVEIKAVLVKGMHNYVCWRKLQDALQEETLLQPHEAEELHKVDAWCNSTKEGSRSSLSFPCSPATWEKVAAESDACNRNACPYYQQCHFFKARRQANDAQILIANHHMLFTDLVYRQEDSNFKDAGLLPAYSRVILDEAHHIEDIATEYFANSISQMDILRTMARLSSEKGGKIQGKLPLLKEKLLENYRNDFSAAITSLHNRLSLDLPGLRRDIQQQAIDSFNTLLNFIHTLKNSSAEDNQGESKLRLLPHHQTHPHWSEEIIPHIKLLIAAITRFVQALASVDADIKLLKNSRLDDQIKGILFEVNALAQRLNGMALLLNTFITEQASLNKVRWIESQTMKTMTNVSLVEADLDVSSILANVLFNKFSTIILCSATLTSNQKFDFIRNRLGLNSDILSERTVKEKIYDSPFDFHRQALLGIPVDMPGPSETSFVQEASEKIWKTIQSSRGNAFVLFTSYSMLKLIYDLLEKRLVDNHFHPLKQGASDRQSLLNKFKVTDRSVLFGTDSFWEGVDVVGDALRCVIIVKLPFRVPNEPLIQARSEAILANGGDPFMEYSLPQAIVKFKQGFGRLIRNKCDRGCIVCLDSRLITKKYGRLFLNSLPACKQVVASSDLLQQQMTDFYRDTHHLVGKKS